ncbi:hypothetical protein [uncultured Paraglaciecola sp.]|uniref:hypothetical protein n=1 Tax=uncultured Paraglaciecola sp. TaxID=1765024 RepID=UPI0025960D9E|nr:hypothetical protein [uncultured Paraglaciecola sp.]
MSSRLKISIVSIIFLFFAFLISQIWKVGHLYEHTERMQGTIGYAFEGRGFTPCGKKEVWWVSSDKGDIGKNLYLSLALEGKSGPISAYIDADMEISIKGNFGHLDMSKREVVLVNIHEMSTEIPTGCEVNFET